MITEFYQHDKYGSGYLGSEEINVIPREGERVRYSGSVWLVHMIIWDMDKKNIEVLLTRL